MPVNSQSILCLLQFSYTERPAQRWCAHIHRRVDRVGRISTFTYIWGRFPLGQGEHRVHLVACPFIPSCSPLFSSGSRPRHSRSLPRCPRLRALFFVPCSPFFPVQDDDFYFITPVRYTAHFSTATAQTERALSFQKRLL
jgi:hypothetical protein